MRAWRKYISRYMHARVVQLVIWGWLCDADAAPADPVTLRVKAAEARCKVPQVGVCVCV